MKETTGQRRRGRRPADAGIRRQAVEKAIADLTEGGVPFSMQDVAERAGISRATLYRDANLRDLVGAAGEGPALRPVTGREYDQLKERAETLAREQRRLKLALRQAEDRARAAEQRVMELTDAHSERERAGRNAQEPPTNAELEQARKEAYADGFAAGVRAAGPRGGVGAGRSGSELGAVAARLPKAALLNARRTLVRALHPDLFAQDPAAALLATELLKQLNAVTQSNR
ncbi:MAG: hypothetical protein SFU56_11180 [Capsulimonadales bacterium]|nr:hypothetical protein [Capsulimonadales bacterium]